LLGTKRNLVLYGLVPVQENDRQTQIFHGLFGWRILQRARIVRLEQSQNSIPGDQHALGHAIISRQLLHLVDFDRVFDGTQGLLQPVKCEGTSRRNHLRRVSRSDPSGFLAAGDTAYEIHGRIAEILHFINIG
jgi:hypothetical protein